MKKLLLSFFSIISFVFFCIWTTFAAWNLIINEIEYDPAWPENQSEWLEIFNNSTETVNLNGWSLTEKKWATNTNTYTFTWWNIKAWKSFLIVNETPDFQNTYWAWIIPNLDLPGTNFLKLSNGWDYLELRDNSNVLIDRVEWENPWAGRNIEWNEWFSVCRTNYSSTWTSAWWTSDCTPTPSENNTNNNEPTDITISSGSILENNLLVWNFSTTDSDSSDTHTYSLVLWAWSEDNSNFSISSTWALFFNTAPDFENPTDNDTDNIYNIRVRTTDNWVPNLNYEKTFQITVLDEAESNSSPWDFVTTWKTDNPWPSCNSCIKIPTSPTRTYNYDIDWDGDWVFDEIWVTGSATHDYWTAWTYQVRIRGDFPVIYFSNNWDKSKILSVDQWWTGQWENMYSTFFGCNNLEILAQDTPDLSQVQNMSNMFKNAKNVGKSSSTGNWNWDISNVTNMSHMFLWAKEFNQPIGNWDTSNVTNMTGMFRWAKKFNQPIGNWNTNKVTDMNSMFTSAESFNQALSNWDTSKVTNMSRMFLWAKEFNQPIGDWDTSKVVTMYRMFYDAKNFNQPIGNWNTSKVTNMTGMFRWATLFNTDINSWNTSKVTIMYRMFYNAKNFNKPLNNWNTSKVIDMRYMFAWAYGNPISFNQDISSWNVSQVRNMEWMFSWNTSFDQPLNNWDVSKVKNMNSMFQASKEFNQDISSWNTSNVTNMWNLFNDARKFNRDISMLDYTKVSNFNLFLRKTDISTNNYDKFIWELEQNYKWKNLYYNAQNIYYCKAWEARQELINNWWNIVDAWQKCDKSPMPQNAPNLSPLSDSWELNTDNITNEILPTFTWNCYTWADVINNTINLYLWTWNTPIWTWTCDNNTWEFSITITNSLTWWTYDINYTQKVSWWTSPFTYSEEESDRSPNRQILIDDKNPHSLHVEVDTLTNNSIHLPILKFQAEDNESWIWKYEIQVDSWAIITQTWTWLLTYSPNWLDTNLISHEIKIIAYDKAWNKIEKIVKYPPVVDILAWPTLSGSTIPVTVNIYWPNPITSVLASWTGSDWTNIWNNLVCPTQPPFWWTWIICNIDVEKTWELKITATDNSLATWWSTQNYIIDTFTPTITFLDDTDLWPTQKDDIKINVIDTIETWWTQTWANLLESSYKYILISWADPCNSTTDFSSWISFTSDQVFSFEDETNNWKYICSKAEDKSWNTAYQRSTNPLNIDITPPVVAFWSTPLEWINTNNQNNNYTLTWTCSAWDLSVEIEISWIISWTWQTITQTWVCSSSLTFSITFANTLSPNLSDFDDWILDVKATQADAAGNKAETTEDIIKITTIPTATISYSETWWTNQDVTMTLTSSWDLQDNMLDWNIINSKEFTREMFDNGTWTVIITDLAWNTWSINFSVTNIDKELPQITLNGTTPITINLWETYTDLWANCIDNTSCVITKSWTVNINQAGTYTITYTATDPAWNTTIETRIVNVVWNWAWNWWEGNTSWVWSWWGWWWNIRDNCPNWDYSPSYYDKTCWKKEIEKKQWNKKENETKKKEKDKNYKIKESLISENIKKVKVNWEIRKYKVNKKTCEIMKNILDDNYKINYKTRFKDISWLSTNSINNIIRIEKTWIIKSGEKWYFIAKRFATRAEFLAIALQAYCYNINNREATNLPFKDIKDLSSWKARVAQVWYDNNIIVWYDDNTFRPNSKISKIEAYTILLRLQKIELLNKNKENKLKDNYKDKKASWQKGPLWLWEYIWILDPKKTNYKFYPDKKLTREEMINLIIKIMKIY